MKLKIDDSGGSGTMPEDETTTILRPTNFTENEHLKNFGNGVKKQASETYKVIRGMNHEEAGVSLRKAMKALKSSTERSLLGDLLNRVRSEDACSIIGRYGIDVYKSMRSNISSETGLSIKDVEVALISCRFAKLCEAGVKEFSEVPGLMKE